MKPIYLDWNNYITKTNGEVIYIIRKLFSSGIHTKKHIIAGLQTTLLINIMRILIVVFVAIALCGYIIILPSSVDAYLANRSYVNVRVKSGDTVWKIASQYISNTEDINEIISVIIKKNNLNDNARISPGQVLQVPVSLNSNIPAAKN